MSTKRIVYTRPDGGVSVVIPNPKFVAQFDTEDEALSALRSKDVPSDAADVSITDMADLPDREFRNAWAQTTPGVVEIDMPKARAIQTERVERAKRAKVRELLEREALGENVTAEKAALRSINAKGIADAPATPADLSAAWPAQLPRPT